MNMSQVFVFVSNGNLYTYITLRSILHAQVHVNFLERKKRRYFLLHVEKIIIISAKDTTTESIRAALPECPASLSTTENIVV